MAPCPLDIHSRGIELACPYPDNELAQSAYYCQWVDCFVHDGISTSAKSKNFIKEVLKTYTAKRIRMMFVLHKYDT